MDPVDPENVNRVLMEGTIHTKGEVSTVFSLVAVRIDTHGIQNSPFIVQLLLRAFSFHISFSLFITRIYMLRPIPNIRLVEEYRLNA